MKINFTYILFIIIFISCQPIEKENSINMNWSTFDLDMPEGIKILEGINKKIPLKAWVAIINLNNNNISVKILSSSDKDKMETPSQFSLNSNALIVLNNGYFILTNSKASHVGLFKNEWNPREPASPSLLKTRYFLSRGAFGLSKDGYQT